MSFRAPYPPIEVEPVFDNPQFVHDLARSAGPYWSVQRYVQNVAEMAALAAVESGVSSDPTPASKAPQLIVPWFRGDWANEHGERIDGVEPILHNPGFIEAARAVFKLPVIEPWLVYINLNPPVPALDPGHVDVPQFIGFDRSRYPIWLLVTMHKSGLFDRWYIPCATAVAWYYEGAGGGFKYWPNGPDAAPQSRPCHNNSALVGDNDCMFHCIEKVGDTPAMMGLSLDSKMRWDGERWEVFEGDGGHVHGHYEARDVRISLSWKGLGFINEASRDRAREGQGGLSLDQVVQTFRDDLAAKGTPTPEPSDPLHEVAFVQALTRAYAIAPSKH